MMHYTIPRLHTCKVINNKNIAYIECSSGYGGSAKCVYQFATAIDTTRYQGYVFCSKINGWYESVQSIGECKVIATNFKPESPSPKGGILLKYAFKAARLTIAIGRSLYFLRKFKEHKIELVHTNNNIFQHIPAVIAAKILSIPIICHLHDQTPFTLIEKIFIPLIDRFFVLAASSKELYSRNIGENKFKVIRNGLLIEDYTEVAVGGDLIDHPAIGVVGRLVSWKGQETLINAAALILKEIPEVKFYIIGDNPNGDKTYGDYLQKMVEDSGLQKSVIFTGWIDDPRQIIRSLDICVCTSVEPEPFGLVILESMLLGTPVISTKHGGPLDIIEEGVDGYFYEPRNHEQLTRLIIMLLCDRKLGAILSKNAIAKIVRQYDIKAIMADIQDSYKELLFGNLLINS